MDFLYLSEEDMIKAGVRNMQKCIDCMEDTMKLLHRGDYRLGGLNNSEHGLRTKFPKESDIDGMPLDGPGRWFTAMPAYLGGKYRCFGFKTYGANQDNTARGIPRSILMMQLLDVVTGAPLAYMSANILSAMRTGGISGLFARKFASANAKKIAVIGPGVIGRYSLDGVMTVCRKVEEVSVFGRGEKSKRKFESYCMKQGYKLKKYQVCPSTEEACKNADIIITASSQAEKFGDYPLLNEGSIKPGACVIVTSAVRISRRYLDDAGSAGVFVADDKRMYMENRGIDAVPKSDAERRTVTVKEALSEWLASGRYVLDLPEIVDMSDFKRDKNAIYFCSSGGIPIEDVSWAYECYQKALENGIGVKLPVWEVSNL